MNNIITYNGYTGTVEYSEKENTLFGKVLGINKVVTYSGTDVNTLRNNFQNAVNEYITECTKNGVKPQKIYKGVFNVRLSKDLHKSLAEYAQSNGKTLNSTVEEAVKEYLSKQVF